MHPAPGSAPSRRAPFIGGNWKMNTDLASGVELAEDLHAALSTPPLPPAVDVVVFPPFPYLQAIGRCLGHAPIRLGAQDLSPQENGAFTGQVSAAMLEDLNVSWVIIGHSERRHGLHESAGLIRAKLDRALAQGLSAVFCIGETLAEREQGRAEAVLVEQLRGGLRGLDREDLRRVVVAYEPVWAIGTGRTAHPSDAAEAHGWVRRTLADLYDAELAAATRVVYGGSVTESTAADLFSMEEIDGGLVGGASLRADAFAAIVRAAAKRLARIDPGVG
jgi:triosephosphate isomerase